jgi:hypothetical protein
MKAGNELGVKTLDVRMAEHENFGFLELGKAQMLVGCSLGNDHDLGSASGGLRAVLRAIAESARRSTVDEAKAHFARVIGDAEYQEIPMRFGNHVIG